MTDSSSKALGGSMEETLSILTQKRGCVRSKITRLCTKVENDFNDFSTNEITLNLRKCNGLRTEIVGLDNEILTCCISLERTEVELTERSEADEVYTDRIDMTVIQLESLNIIDNNPNSSNDEPVRSNAVSPGTYERDRMRFKLPEVPLPEFGNRKGDNLAKFLNSFESIVNKNRLSSYEKFVYLQKQLSGGPKVLIDSLDVAEQSYEKAKELLQTAFDSTEKSKSDLIRTLSNLKLHPNTEPYNFIGEMRTVISGVENLNITIEDVMQYFVWTGLNSDFQSHLTAITNKSKPTLADINEGIFEATDRYIKQMNEKKHSREDKKFFNSNKITDHTNAMAVNVKYSNNKPFCVLCTFDKKQNDHSLRLCPAYSNPRAKFNKLKSIRACCKCSFSNHETQECKFVFKTNCANCNGGHMTYLCLKPQTHASSHSNVCTSPENSLMTNREVYNNISIVEAAQITSSDAMILPTFTAQLMVQSDTEVPVRIFKDSGCQQTFVGSALAELLHLPVITQNIPLVIHGFNSSKNIQTKLVEINLKIGEKIFSLKAMCIDDIKTKFPINGIGPIVSAFQQKGFKMADATFNGSSVGFVENIDLVLGTDSDHILPLRYRPFGNPVNPDDLSSFIDTPIGVILSVSVTKMLKNLEYLPEVDESKNFNTVEGSIFVNPPSVVASSSISSVDEECPLHNFENSLEVTVNSQFSDHDMYFSPKLNQTESLPGENQLVDKCKDALNICEEIDDSIESETNIKLTEFVLENTWYDSEGRLVMPLTWNHKNSHLLSQNYALAYKILMSTLDKLNKDPNKLKMYDTVFREQQELKIIEKIDNLDNFLLQHPESSFLPHMGIFRMSNETTKCRIVFLSNMFEKKGHGISHNMAMLPGPNLNHKISTAVLHNRFNKFLLTFDIKKAFLNIKLNECDMNRLCFLWFKNVEKGNFEVVGYRNVRLSFGLRCSPAILMLGLFKILMLDKSGNADLDEIKRAIFNTIYMDNGSYSCNDETKLLEAYRALDEIFPVHKLELQQYCTNSENVQNTIDSENDSETPSSVKFFGMHWNRELDSLSPMKVDLDVEANTKRKILASVNAIYDVYNVYAPILMRAKLFLQTLLTNRDLTWDSRLSESLQHEWIKIVKQANACPVIGFPRFVGNHDATYSLVAFTDASKDAYGVVIYLKDLDTGKVSYLTAKNRLVNTATSKKSMPSLEFQGVSFGLETLFETYQSLCGETVVKPITIASSYLFTDSTTCLHWIENYSIYFDKMRSISVFVKNRLRIIDEICNKMPVTFYHIAGEMNPSDFVTRPLGYKALLRSNYYKGPDILSDDLALIVTDLKVTLPNPICRAGDEVPSEIGCSQLITSTVAMENNHLVPLDRYSSFTFLVNVTGNVLKFIDKLKCRILKKRKILNSTVPDETSVRKTSNCDYFKKALYHIIATEQKKCYAEVFSYYENKSERLKDIPELMNKFNLYRDESHILRIQSKFDRKVDYNPILLPSNSQLTTLIVRHTHVKLGHSGIYATIREVRKNFWIEKCFSTVKKVYKSCIICKKVNERPIQLNQNKYREFRSNPPRKPFQSVFLDYIGPFTIDLQGERKKVWLLIITCLWSRAIDLKVCLNANVYEFLKAIQLHCFEYGIFESCISDLGSQIQCGAHSIKTFLSDHESRKFLNANGINDIEFQHYAKGNSSLGSIVESCVKQVKFMIYKSIGTKILDFFDFQFLIYKCVHLINKRPIAFRESLRSLPPDQIPTCITPEILLRGYDCTSVNVIPQLQPIEDVYEPNSSIKTEHDKLRKVREKLVEVYHVDFLANLIHQAVDKTDRYKPVARKIIKKGDIVLLVDKFHKRYYYPMGRVLSVETNSIGEVTAAKVVKGDTRETVYRHVTSLILLLPSEICSVGNEADEVSNEEVVSPPPSIRRPKARQASIRCRQRLQNLAIEDSI